MVGQRVVRNIHHGYGTTYRRFWDCCYRSRRSGWEDRRSPVWRRKVYGWRHSQSRYLFRRQEIPHLSLRLSTFCSDIFTKEYVFGGQRFWPIHSVSRDYSEELAGLTGEGIGKRRGMSWSYAPRPFLRRQGSASSWVVQIVSIFRISQRDSRHVLQAGVYRGRLVL